MIKIALIHLDSGRHDKARFASDRREFLAPLRQELDLVTTRIPRKMEADLQAVFIASGGSEQKFRRLMPAQLESSEQCGYSPPHIAQGPATGLPG